MKKTLLALTLVASLAIGTSMIASAADGATSVPPTNETSVSTNLSTEELKANMKAAKFEKIDNLIKDGRITAEKGEELKSTIGEKIDNCVNPGSGNGEKSGDCNGFKIGKGKCVTPGSENCATPGNGNGEGLGKGMGHKSNKGCK
ncbi:MAG: hypothetical protein RR891_01740 [Clostridium sp.]|uniref:hypothetical protein n=1 Tax=Clostridium sp. TaxID=1506 RepID=UPI0030400F8A